MRAKSLVAVVLFVGVVSAQDPSRDERVYQAIRADDLQTLRALVGDGDVNAKDATGQTPLMVASAIGSLEAVRMLLASRADAKIVSGSGVTALHLAVTDAAKTRLLLEAGANADGVSQLGRTPLLIAASATGTEESVRLLLARGANVNAADSVGVSPLIAAAAMNNAAVARLLLAAGADPAATANIGQSATALMGAADNANVDLLRTLLARAVDVHAVSADRAGIVKNGAVLFGNVTALHQAVSSGSVDAVRLLLDAGARVDSQDIRGMTPLVWSVSTDRPDPEIVRLLVARGADPAVRTRDNESAIDWARKFNNPAVLKELGLRPVSVGAVRLVPTRAVPTTPRRALEQALPLLRLASGRMLTDGGCAACHAQPMAALTIELARARGWTSDLADGHVAQGAARLAADVPAMLQVRDGGGAPDTQLYMAVAMAAHGTAPSRATDALLLFLTAKQRADGSWRGVGATRAPMQDGDFSRTALAIRAITTYGAPARARVLQDSVARAAGWLAQQRPLTTEDRVMQLLGLSWAGSHAPLRQTRARELGALQRPDGGWAQTPHLESDAYATGQALFTLRELGAPAGDAGLQRGAMFLLRTQQEDGSWHVKSRAMKIQPYFESGFPHGHDQWISQTGTSWAAMALAVTAADAPAATRAAR